MAQYSFDNFNLSTHRRYLSSYTGKRRLTDSFPLDSLDQWTSFSHPEVFSLLLFLPTCLNPILYGFMYRSVRNEFKSIIKNVSSTSPPRISMGMSEFHVEAVAEYVLGHERLENWENYTALYALRNLCIMKVKRDFFCPCMWLISSHRTSNSKAHGRCDNQPSGRVAFAIPLAELQSKPAKRSVLSQAAGIKGFSAPRLGRNHANGGGEQQRRGGGDQRPLGYVWKPELHALGIGTAVERRRGVTVTFKI